MKARPQVQAFVAGSTPKIERPPGYLGAVGTGGSVLLAGLVHMGLNGVTPLMAGVQPASPS